MSTKNINSKFDEINLKRKEAHYQLYIHNMLIFIKSINFFP